FGTIGKAITAVENEEVDFCVVPIENFYNGEVRETLDDLTECSKTKIIKEKVLKIIYCIGALENHDEIEEVLSKDQALEQCNKYLFKNYPKIKNVAVSSTSEAANKIARENLLNSVAIASEEAVKEAGLKILDKNICPGNKTRFVVIGRNKTEPTGDDKTFLAIHPSERDKPGTLANILNIFSSYSINLENIQSRPDGQKGYYFYIELEGHEKDKIVKAAIEGISLSLDPKNKFPNTVKILGSYQNSHWKGEN
ncbi:MAG: prephenate dehydratase, partial [Candidatus Nanoarchaeia archaeon]